MENKNGQGIFYGVIGVATLVVAIIGATFAYFSASVTANGDDITGNTANVAGSLSLEVERVDFEPSPAPSYDDLVPAAVAETEAGWGSMLTHDCVDGDYTGCHLYKVTAGTDTDVSASVEVVVTTTANPATNWKYVVYRGTESTITSNSASLHAMNSAAYTAFSGTLDDASDEEFYVLVYLLNTSSSQNDGDTAGTTDETGTYTGTVTLKAASGNVKATFS